MAIRESWLEKLKDESLERKEKSEAITEDEARKYADEVINAIESQNWSHKDAIAMISQINVRDYMPTYDPCELALYLMI